MKLGSIGYLLIVFSSLLQVVMAECVGDFPRREQIEEAITRQSGLHQVEDSEFLFTSISFTCGTTITGWIIAGNATGRNNSVYPEIRTWRLETFNPNQFRVQSSSIASSVSQLNTGSLYQYILDTPVQVMAGDVLGIRVPPKDELDVVPLFNLSSSTVEYYVASFDNDLGFFIINSPGRSVQNLSFPLVAPIISGDPTMSSIMSTQVQSSSSAASSISLIATAISTMTTSVAITSNTGSTNNGSFSQSSTIPTASLHTVSLAFSYSSTTTQQGDTTSSIMSLFPQTNTVSAVRDTTSLETSTFLSSSTAQTTSMSPTVGITSNVPTSVIAGSVIAAVLVIVIVGLLLVLVFLVVLNKRSKDEGEVAYPPDAYVNAPSPIDNPNYTAAFGNNVQLVSVQSNSSTLNGDDFATHYEVPEFSDPIVSPAPIYYENLHDGHSLDGMIKAPGPGGIYSANMELELDGFSSQTALINDHYEMDGMNNGINPYSVLDSDGHYEMEPNGVSHRTEYEKPVSSRSNTIVRQNNDQQHQVVNPHDYSVLDGSIFVPNEEERKILKQHSSVFDEHCYAHLGIIQKQKYENVCLFEKDDIFWKPATIPSALYDQLSQRKFREIPRSHLKITKHLGSGQFGTVNEGVWSAGQAQIAVAVKLVSPTAAETEKVKLLREGATMGQFDHRNVVKLHGLVTVGEPVMIVIELMPRGDLRDHLKTVRFEHTQSQPLPDLPEQLVQFCKEVAEGMEYLSSKSYVHRDLAARNIFLTEHLVCKIGDFGMSRDLDDDDYYVSQGGKIPIKWTAPEALRYKKYSPLSDVWSFGALMYEIWSLAHKPFEGFSNSQTIDLVHSGYRLPPPPGCPRSIYQLMIRCWHPESSKRPKFIEVVEILSVDPKQILRWRDIDKAVHIQAANLGGPLEAGQDLYPELQQTFLRNTIKN